MKVAIVHEWLITYAGSERVVEQLLKIYPEADLFAVCDFMPEGDRAFLGERRPVTTFIQKLPFARKHFRSYLPLMPLAIEQLDLSAYDLVISSNHAVAKGVITGPHQVHISYVHSPMRYAWDLQHQYLNESGMSGGVKSTIARALLHYLRHWDRSSAAGVDHFIANSAFIARRIEKVYRRSATVIYPPVDVERFTMREDKEEFFLSASRLVPYKRVPLIVDAFATMPDKKLVVIGDGPDMPRIQRNLPPNVTLLGHVSGAVLVDHMQRARAMVFAAEEDFGIAPVEAQACGTPVIAYGRGGALETVASHGAGTTGAFFFEQSLQSIATAVKEFADAPGRTRPTHCRNQAERFSESTFRRSFSECVDATLALSPANQAQPSDFR